MIIGWKVQIVFFAQEEKVWRNELVLYSWAPAPEEDELEDEELRKDLAFHR